MPLTRAQKNGQLDAFPSHDHGYSGLTKREYVAALALQGILAHHGAEFKDAASMAAECADELLDQLDSTEPKPRG